MATFGPRERAGEASLATLSDYLGGKRLLLILDNFEHLLQAAPTVSELLRRVGDVSALVTSREPLRINHEREYPLAPLSDSAAVELFVERARPSPRGSEGTQTIIDICRKLDGLPLAIELAAARTKILCAGAAGKARQTLDSSDRRCSRCGCAEERQHQPPTRVGPSGPWLIPPNPG